MARYKTTCVKKGRHWAWPIRFAATKSGFYWTIRTNSSMIYLIDGEDQWDYNKLVGIKLQYFKPMEDTMMLGWRFSPKTGLLEFAPYQHTNGERIIGDVIYSCKAGEIFDVKISFSGDLWSLQINNETPIQSLYESRKDKIGYEILNWFGGNKEAPHDISFDFIRR